MVPAEGYVNIETFDIETSTVRLNPFPTSLNILTILLESNQLTLRELQLPLPISSLSEVGIPGFRIMMTITFTIL